MLYAAHGPVSWAEVIDASCGRGAAIRMQRWLGDLAGVALLTAAVRDAYAAAIAEHEQLVDEGELVQENLAGDFVTAWRRGRVEQPRLARLAPMAFLAAILADKSEPGKRRAERVLLQAQALLAEALEIFRTTRMATDPTYAQREREHGEQAREEQARRRATLGDRRRRNTAAEET